MRSKTFRDFDAFAASVRDVDSKMMLRNPERRVWSISSVDLDRIDVQIGRLGSGNIAEGQMLPEGCMLYLPLTDAVEYTANGRVLDTSSFAILEPGSEFCISTKVEHDWIAVTVPTEMLARDGNLPEPPSGSKPATLRVTRGQRRAADQFRDLVDQVMTAAVGSPQFESTPAATCAAAELLKVASLVLGQPNQSQPHREGRPQIPREEVIRRFRKTLEQRESQRVRVSELATAVDVSERTLRNVFGEYYGVGPTRYLQLRQLHHVRRALCAADAEATSVSDILTQHGEWEFSRFASRYRRLFGERPLDTLRTKNR